MPQLPPHQLSARERRRSRRSAALAARLALDGIHTAGAGIGMPNTPVLPTPDPAAPPADRGRHIPELRALEIACEFRTAVEYLRADAPDEATWTADVRPLAGPAVSNLLQVLVRLPHQARSEWPSSPWRSPGAMGPRASCVRYVHILRWWWAMRWLGYVRGNTGNGGLFTPVALPAHLAYVDGTPIGAPENHPTWLYTPPGGPAATYGMPPLRVWTQGVWGTPDPAQQPDLAAAAAAIEAMGFGWQLDGSFGAFQPVIDAFERVRVVATAYGVPGDTSSPNAAAVFGTPERAAQFAAEMVNATSPVPGEYAFVLWDVYAMLAAIRFSEQGALTQCLNAVALALRFTPEEQPPPPPEEPPYVPPVIGPIGTEPAPNTPRPGSPGTKPGGTPKPGGSKPGGSTKPGTSDRTPQGDTPETRATLSTWLVVGFVGAVVYAATRDA